MSAECVQNAANAAAKRRELRRRKVLQNPEDRMKRIIGYSLSGNEPVKIHPGDRIGDAAEGDPPVENSSSNLYTENHAHNEVERESFHRRVQPQHHQQSTQLNSTEDQNSATPPVSSLLGNLLANNSEIKEETVTKDDSNFQKIRQILCAVLGVLTRLSFLCSFGNEYVQTIVYPFVFLEIALIGYQKIIGMELGASVKGGLWLSVLVLAGIKREVVETYKTVMGAFTTAADDFTVFFFAFVFIHLFIP